MQSVASTTNHATREFSPPANSDNGSSVWDNGSAQLIELDRLLADSLLRFVNQPAEAMERELAVVTRLLLDAGGFDRCGLMKFAPDKNSATAVHVSHREGGIALPEVLTSRESFPWATERLVSGNIISFADPADLPPRAKPDRQQFAALVAMSYLAIPIYMGSSVEYFIFAQQACPGRSWHKSLISVLRLTGETFVKTLARSVEGRQVSQQLRFEQLITELSVRFINVAPNRVDHEIMAALQQLLEFFQFDRCGLLTYSPDKKQVLVTHACYGNGIVPVPEKVDISYLYPWANEKLLSGQFIHFSSLAELPPEAVVDRHTWQAIGVKSNINIPIQIGGSVEYLIAGQDTRSHRRGQDELLLRLRLVGEIFANALIRCRAEEARIKACEEILALREKLQLEAEQLQSEIKLTKVHDGMIGKSVALAKVLGLVEQVAPTDATVLVVGETGTGKELVARAIHQFSPRGSKSMVKVNCASLPATLVESELFGREKGAFTGALTRQAGRFEVADGTSIFLDEIAELSLELQAKLLRVLQEGQFERLGSTRTIQVNVRVIAATNRNLSEEVKQGRFREDLYYRLNVFKVEVPPLRERVEDIPLLAWAFVNEFGEKMGKKINRISKQDMAAMQGYEWPGNIRELRNIIEHAVIVSTGELLHIKLPTEGNIKTFSSYALADVERQHILDVLQLTNWCIKGATGAARKLGLNPSTLYSRMQKLGINKP